MRNGRGLLLGALLLVGVAPEGSAQEKLVRLKSRILGEERTVHVSLPPNYALAARRYQVTYLLDGHVRAFFDLTVAAAGYDLSGDPRDYAIPPQIVVGVEQKDRGIDLGRNQELFARYLGEELVPFIDRTYRTEPRRTLVGHSLGGRFALNALCRNPGMFAAVVAISPGIGDSASLAAVTRCLTQQFGAGASTLHQLVLIAGEREPRLLAGVNRLREFLRDSAPPAWRWTILDGAGLGHTETPFVAIPRGIRLVHDRAIWEMPEVTADSLLQAKGDPEQIVSSWYRTLSARMGYAVQPSAKWLSAVTAAHMAQRDLDRAAAAAAHTLAAYPEELGAYATLADICVARADPAGARRVLADALRMLDRLEFFDETERAQKRAILRASLGGIGPP